MSDRGDEHSVNHFDILGVIALESLVMLAQEIFKKRSELIIVRLVGELVAEDLAHELLQLGGALCMVAQVVHLVRQLGVTDLTEALVTADLGINVDLRESALLDQIN